MAQKSDTFGKDSEASVALGQGKPVIVYVPRLHVPDANIDSERLGLTSRSELSNFVKTEASGEDAEVDETTDNQALLSQILTIRLSKASGRVLSQAARDHWADFDLYGEASRITDGEKQEGAKQAGKERAAYRAWLDRIVKGDELVEPSADVRQHLINILVATATNFEKRARIFREVHPLALQVILSTGVLNGILVVRSNGSCAELLARLVRRDLELELQIDDQNYRLIERKTGSTIRVISRHNLITNAFSAFYTRMSEAQAKSMGRQIDPAKSR